MSPLLSGSLLLCGLFVLLATGMPIAFALGLVSIIALILSGGFGVMEIIGETFFGGLASFSLVAIPMFILMGAAVASSPAGRDLYEALDRWLNRIPGGLVLSNIGACSVFSALSGSSPATCAAIGKMGIPEMLERGYPATIATGSIAAGGTLGILIPPSVTMIVYGIATETSIGRLFLAGLLPGLMLTVLFMVWTIISCRLAGYNFERMATRFTLKQRLEALPRVLPFLSIVVAILYVLYGGVATPSEAAGAGALFCIVLAVVIYRMWRPSQFVSMFRSTIKELVMIMMIIGASELFAFTLSSLFITQSIADVDRRSRCRPLGAAGLHQPVPAGRRLLPAAGRGDLDDGTDPPADHHPGRLRPLLVRGDLDHQHGDRPDHPAGGPQSLCHQRHCAGRVAGDDPQGCPALRALHGAGHHHPLLRPRHRHLAADLPHGTGALIIRPTHTFRPTNSSCR